jgi:hypothetical protein
MEHADHFTITTGTRRRQNAAAMGVEENKNWLVIMVVARRSTTR